ncbi:HlyD family type I secretion periplasmic adaptor subunit [Rhizobium sp. S152]|uniref:HlyD family type I secretion periplasmic adaptor subunit n=1 Tax=Rhizobium sp. S152 TaxID=3055038 RepID=UPI0025A9FD0B|nr:HlyD family type I secretion periplasmic adaptor subunit [Rhizobium sp. S152]MDM9624833.1 HlyD family type I secretion periplasmic adaptor subunit [Rhizobium sp. S152]
MIGDPAPLAAGAIRKLAFLVLAMVILLVGVIGGLAATIHLNGAVIASGTLVVDSYVKPVQHQKGGTVGKVLVRNEERVEAGQILVHLDDTQSRANLAIIRRRLQEFSARTARLVAERDGKDHIELPASLPDDEMQSTVAGERKLFDDRRTSLRGREAQLRERIRQLDRQSDGLVAQQDGKRRAIEIIQKELASLQPLYKQGIIPATRIYALERDAADLSGELGSLVASAAEIRGKIAETELQVIQVGDDLRSEVSDQLRQTESDTGEYSERLVAAEDDLKHVDIRAPQAGIVHQLAVHAAGAVVTPGEAIMQIVPDQDALTPELRLSPDDIDQVAVGQEVALRFSAFNQRTTPELRGHVLSIAADITSDQRSGQSFYNVRVRVPQSEWARLGTLVPVAGMPVEAFIETGERTALAYMAKPFADQMARAFREE